MERFIVNGINYTCKLMDIAENDPSLTTIRISSQGSQNMYIWRDGFAKPYALPNNARTLADPIILKAFELLKGNSPDVKYKPKRKDIISKTAPSITPINTITTLTTSTTTNKNTMYQVVDALGSISLFSNTDDVVKFSLGKVVTITEVVVTISTNKAIVIPDEIVEEEILEIPAPDIEVVKQSYVEDHIQDDKPKTRRVTRDATPSGRGKGRAKKDKVIVPEE